MSTDARALESRAWALYDLQKKQQKERRAQRAALIRRVRRLAAQMDRNSTDSRIMQAVVTLEIVAMHERIKIKFRNEL